MQLGQIPANVLRGVIDDDHLNDLKERNKARAQRLIEQMGRNYCCHLNYQPKSVARPLSTH